MSETPDSKPRSRYWRSLNELEQTPEFEAFMQREFPVGASELPEGVSRRRWMKLMGASIALGTVSSIGCRYAEETIAPFVIRPDGRIPGEQHFTATNIEWAGRVYNLVVTGVDGRPIKVEGNAEHPASNGGTDAYVQGSILHLYDPDRLAGIVSRKDGLANPDEDAWEDFAASTDNKIGVKGFGAVRDGLSSNQGEGFGILMPPSQSPSLARLLADLQKKFPKAVIGRHDPVRGTVVEQATQAALGRVARPVYDTAAAKLLCCIDADLLGTDHGFLSNAGGFSAGREPVAGKMNRLYAIESNYTNTGMAADTRYALQPSQMAAFIASLEKRVDGLLAGDAHDHSSETSEGFDRLPPAERIERLLDVLAHDLVEHQGNSLVAVGEHLGAEALAAGYRLNSKLKNFGSTIRFAEPVDAALDSVSLAEFVEKVNSGNLKSIAILGGNPVYAAPGDVDVAAAIAKAESSVYIGEYDDETAFACQWVLPATHPFESWGDCQGDDGYYGVTQPQILPLLSGKTNLEYLSWFLGNENVSPEAIVRKTADIALGTSLNNRQWRQLLHDGYVKEIVAKIPAAEFKGSDAPLTETEVVAASEYKVDGLDVVMVPADGVYDGRFANNGWLQEMPQSLTKLTWDNAAVMSPSTAESLGVGQGKVIALGDGEGAIELPVFELPGHAPGAATIALGYGRRRAGAVGGSEDLGGDYVGFDVASLRTSDSLGMAAAVSARPRSTQYKLATTQDHFAIDELGFAETADRAHRLIRELGLEKMEEVEDAHQHTKSVSREQFETMSPEEAEEFEHEKHTAEYVKHMGVHSPPLESLWVEPMDEFKEDGYDRPQWGMAIDLNKCVGCNACVVACQSENNVPIVGKEQVSNGREMHWIRVDRYFSGDPENQEDSPLVVQQPLTCQHCETAPCEQVCPVAATVHTEEGINAMAYNRCIGTRYCANNCPYKVRRFNYFNYNEEIGTGYGIDSFPGKVEQANRKLQQLVLNPEVSVRGRGVMEKCTFCIQRVEKAKIDARRKTGETGGAPEIVDGSLQTACQQACSCKAIEFGNLTDKDSAVSGAHASARRYDILDQLNTKPRNAYLARVRNTHPRLQTYAQLHADDHGHHESEHGEEHQEHGSGDDDHTKEPPVEEQATQLPILGEIVRA